MWTVAYDSIPPDHPAFVARYVTQLGTGYSGAPARSYIQSALFPGQAEDELGLQALAGGLFEGTDQPCCEGVAKKKTSPRLSWVKSWLSKGSTVSNNCTAFKSPQKARHQPLRLLECLSDCRHVLRRWGCGQRRLWMSIKYLKPYGPPAARRLTPMFSAPSCKYAGGLCSPGRPRTSWQQHSFCLCCLVSTGCWS